MDSDEKRRRILIIGGVVLLLIATFIALYFVFFRTPKTPEEVPPPTFGEASGTREGVSPSRSTDKINNEGVFSPIARLRLLSEEPVAGATSIYKDPETPSGEIVRYNEQETAHVYDIALSNLDKDRISNTTIPRIYESLWTAGGNGVILRYLADDNETIKTYYANLIEKTDELREGQTPYDLKGTFLTDNIKDIVLSPNKTKIFWFLKDGFNGTRGTISNPNGEGATVVFSSPFTEWLPQWVKDNLLILTTKASGYAGGFAYEVPIATGELSRVVGDISGLTTLASPDEKYILYSKGTERGLSTYLLNTGTGEVRELSIQTMPEKCTWSKEDIAYCGVPEKIKSAVYPDSWYQGKILFADKIYSVDAETLNTEFIYSPLSKDQESIDIYKPFISKSGDYLIFNNKRDMSLWAFTLKEPDEHIVVPDGAIF